MTILATALAFLAGGLWRRWWGTERPSYAFPGYRAVQASLGVLALVLLGRMAGDSWGLAAVRAGGCVGFLSLPIAISRAWAERPWLWIERRYGTPRWPPWFDGWTTYAEATAGALVFGIAMLIR